MEREAAPAIYRIRVTHLRRAPVHHYVEHNSYGWYVDVDELPRIPRWLASFARFEATDHFDGAPDDSLRDRVDAFLARRGIDLGGGQITALLQARVLGFSYHPLSLFWCHDAQGVLRHVIAEVQNTFGERHAYLLPPSGPNPAMVRKQLYTSRFTGVDGYYLVRAPRPEDQLDMTVSLHRENQPAIVTTLRGNRRQATAGQLLRLQFSAPVAPLMTAMSVRIHGAILRMRRVPVVPRTSAAPAPVADRQVAQA